MQRTKVARADVRARRADTGARSREQRAWVAPAMGSVRGRYHWNEAHRTLVQVVAKALASQLHHRLMDLEVGPGQSTAEVAATSPLLPVEALPAVAMGPAR